jgi:hypothetical protein
VAVGLAGDKELGARVDAEDAVEFFLLIYHQFPIPSLLVSAILVQGIYLGHITQMPKTHDPRIAAHDIEPAKMLHRVIHQFDRLRDLSDVGLEGDRVGPQALDLGDDFLGRFPRVGVVDDDFGAAAAKFYSHSGADAATRAGDEGDFSVEAVGDVGGGHFVGCGEKRC